MAGYGNDAYATPSYQTSYGQHAAYQSQFQSHGSYSAQANQYQQPAAANPSQPKQTYASEYLAAPTDTGYGSQQPSQQTPSQWGAGSYGANTGQQPSRPPAAAQVWHFTGCHHSHHHLSVIIVLCDDHAREQEDACFAGVAGSRISWGMTTPPSFSPAVNRQLRIMAFFLF